MLWVITWCRRPCSRRRCLRRQSLERCWRCRLVIFFIRVRFALPDLPTCTATTTLEHGFGGCRRLRPAVAHLGTSKPRAQNAWVGVSQLWFEKLIASYPHFAMQRRSVLPRRRRLPSFSFTGFWCLASFALGPSPIYTSSPGATRRLRGSFVGSILLRHQRPKPASSACQQAGLAQKARAPKVHSGCIRSCHTAPGHREEAHATRDFADALIASLVAGADELVPGAVAAHMTPPVLDPCSRATLTAIAQHAARVLASPRPEADLLIPGWLLGDEIPAPRVGEGGRCNLCGCGAVRAPTCPRLSAYIRALFHSAAAGMTAVGAPTAPPPPPPSCTNWTRLVLLPY